MSTDTCSDMLPRLDVAHLPGWAGDYARALAAHTETPPELAAGMILVSCATAAARRLRVMVERDYWEPCNLWALVALPGGNRKSAVQSAATAPLLAWERERDRSAITPPQIWTSGATPERLASLLAEHGDCMAWLSSDGGVFELLLEAWSGDQERADRVLRPPVYLHSPRLSIGLTLRPDVLRGLAAKPGFPGRGLLGRFLYLLPLSPLGFRTLQSDPVPESVLDAYVAGIRAMLDWGPRIDEHGTEGPQLLHLDRDAYQRWHDYAVAIEGRMQPGNDLQHCIHWARNAPGAAARLAGVLHGIEHADGKPLEHAISAETMTSAKEIMDVIASHSLAAFRLMGARG